MTRGLPPPVYPPPTHPPTHPHTPTHKHTSAHPPGSVCPARVTPTLPPPPSPSGFRYSARAATLQDSATETHSTLVFAAGAKKIRNRAVVNQETAGDVQALKLENARLQRELAARDVSEREGGCLPASCLPGAAPVHPTCPDRIALQSVTLSCLHVVMAGGG